MAFSLMALAVVVLMRVFSGALYGIGQAEDHARAASLAQSKIAGLSGAAAAGEVPAAGESAGVEAGRYRWRVRVRPYRDPAAGDALPPGVMRRAQLFEVEVAVLWGEAERPQAAPRRLELSTLVLAPLAEP